MSAPLTALRRVGGMLVIASLCALLTGPALASTPDRRAASSVATKTTISTAGARSVAWADAPLALATKVARGVTYGGSTSGDDPIVIVLSHDGTSVRRISTRFEATCSDGPQFMVFVDGPLDRTINAAGRFIGMSSGTDDLGSGVTAHNTASLKGRGQGQEDHWFIPLPRRSGRRCWRGSGYLRSDRHL